MPTGPSGRREESVQFSLKELLQIEDERLEEQQRATTAREAALARQKEEDAQRLQAEAEMLARTEAERREAQRKTELDELARREAMQKAIVEQGRLEVEVRARADERERERNHELAIERLRKEGDRSASLGPLAMAAGMGGAIVFAVMLTIQLGVTKPAADRRIAEAQTSVVAAETHADALQRQLEEQARAVRERDQKLSEARAEIDSLKVKKTPASSPNGPKLVPNPNPGPRKPPSPAEPDCVDPHDPMCFSLKTVH